jgi:hypothetical protein
LFFHRINPDRTFAALAKPMHMGKSAMRDKDETALAVLALVAGDKP